MNLVAEKRLRQRGQFGVRWRAPGVPAACPTVGSSPALIPLLALDEEGFRERFRHSPVKRAKRRGLLRNVCVALGNIGDPVAVPGADRTRCRTRSRWCAATPPGRWDASAGQMRAPPWKARFPMRLTRRYSRRFAMRWRCDGVMGAAFVWGYHAVA